MYSIEKNLIEKAILEIVRNMKQRGLSDIETFKMIDKVNDELYGETLDRKIEMLLEDISRRHQ